MRLQIALLQLDGRCDDQTANQVAGEQACREAAAQGADIPLFPEMWNIGYSAYRPDVEGAVAAWQAQAIERDSPFVRHFQALAGELGMAIALTYLERRDGPPANAMVLIDRHGSIVLAYAKIHICDYEVPEVSCTPGEDAFVASLDTAAGPVAVGAMICADREFPETARLLMLKGAEIILTPNACQLATCPIYGDARLAQLRGRAIESLAGIAMTNYPAPRFDGHSIAFDAHGATIVAADDGQGIWFADFDLERIRALRRDEPYRTRYQRPDCYRLLGPSG